MPSPTVIVAERIKRATARGQAILLTGVTMGGGPSHWAARDHALAGCKVAVTPEAGRTFDDDLAQVERMGFEIIADEEAARRAQHADWQHIELQDFEHRALTALRDRGRYSNLVVAHDGQLVFSFAPPDGPPLIRTINYKEGRDGKTILEGFGDFRLSADGRKLFVRQETNLAVVEPASNQKIDRQIKLESMNVAIDSRAEGHQIFNDAWRLYRDFFYDQNMRGVNWPAMRIKYSKLIETCSWREDVYEIIGEMLAIGIHRDRVGVAKFDGALKARAQRGPLATVAFQSDHDTAG